MEIFDCHTHFFSYSFFEGLVNQQTPPGDPSIELLRISGTAGLEAPHPDTGHHTQRWLAEMDRHGLKGMVTFASLPSEAPVVAEALEISGGRLIGYTLVNAADSQAPLFVEKAASLGFRGLLLFPVMHRYSAADERLWPVLDAAQAHKMVVVIHFGMLAVSLRDILRLPRPFDMRFGNPLDLQITANRFPDTPFVIPHFGCGFFRETLMLGALCENVRVDTSSSNSWLDTQPEAVTLSTVFRKTHKVFGRERILFGTDSSTFPRGWRKDILETQLAHMKLAGISEGDQEAILGGNIRELLGM